MTTKVHFERPGRDPNVMPLTRPICGELGAIATIEPGAVTCKRCLKLLRKTPKPASARERAEDASDAARALRETIEEADRARARQAFWADLGGLPVLTPTTYARRDCTCRSLDCPVCRFFMRLDQDEYASPNKKTHALYDPTRARWSSVTAALESYVVARADGSSAGGWGYQLDVFRRLGVRVQADGPTDSAAERQADDAMEVERALAHAFDRHNDRGLGLARCIAILLARVVGRLETVDGTRGQRAQRRAPVPADELVAAFPGVSVEMVRGIVKSGRQRIYEHLCARGLVEAKHGRTTA